MKKRRQNEKKNKQRKHKKRNIKFKEILEVTSSLRHWEINCYSIPDKQPPLSQGKPEWNSHTAHGLGNTMNKEQKNVLCIISNTAPGVT